MQFPSDMTLGIQAKEFNLGRFLVVQILLHLRMMATMLIGTYNDAELFMYPFQDLCLDTIMSRRSVGPYRQVCAFPNHVKSTEFTRWTSSRNISMMISGNRMHLSSILSIMAKAVKMYMISSLLKTISQFF